MKQGLIFSNVLCGLFFMLLFSNCAAPVKHVPKVYIVEMKEMQFQPAQLTVEKGDTVLFINRDMVAHNIVDATKGAWSSSLLANGASWKLPVTESADYICTIHPTMKGNIIVK